MKKGVITASVVDLRKEPQDLLPRDFSHHPLRNSQLLFGEKIQVLETHKQWLHIEALEQELYTQDRGWHAYPGWIRATEVHLTEDASHPNCVVCVPWLEVSTLAFSFGTFLHQTAPGHILLPTGETIHCDPKMVRPLPCSFSRETLFKDAELFLGAPYLWGGCGSFSKTKVSSVDCSSFIHLLHRAQGVFIPRDAHDQYLKALPLEPHALQCGDSIYLSREGKPERITHVVLYSGNSTFLEAPETGKNVRALSFLSSLNDRVQLEERPYPYHAHYGSFFPNAFAGDKSSLGF